MKKYWLLLLINLITLTIKAQDTQVTVDKKDWLTDGVREKFSVLKSDGKTKQGLYEAIYSPTGSVIAKGKYEDGERTGIWQFLDIYQRVVEVFDYTQYKLIGEEPADKQSRQYIRYKFDVKARDTDRLTKPIRIGGRCFGYIPYLQIFKLSKAYNDFDSRQLNAQLELLISPGGRLADLKVHIFTPDGYDNVTSFSPDIFSDEDKKFIPATFNGRPIISRIFLICRITDAGTLDVE